MRIESVSEAWEVSEQATQHMQWSFQKSQRQKSGCNYGAIAIAEDFLECHVG